MMIKKFSLSIAIAFIWACNSPPPAVVNTEALSPAVVDSLPADDNLAKYEVTLTGKKLGDSVTNDNLVGRKVVIAGLKFSDSKASSKDLVQIEDGGRSRASIQRVVMQNLPAFRYAYNKRLRENSELSGTIKVKFYINEHGEVFSVLLVESTINDSELEDFVVTRVKDFKFEAINKPEDVTEVIYPFAFSQ